MTTKITVELCDGSNKKAYFWCADHNSVFDQEWYNAVVEDAKTGERYTMKELIDQQLTEEGENNLITTI